MTIAVEGKIELPQPPQSLRELFDRQIELAQMIFNEQKEIHPMWVGQDADGILYPIAATFSSQSEKEEVVAGIKDAFRRLKVVRYVSMVEAWVVTGESEELPKVRPSEHPERKEVVFLTGEGIEEPPLFGHLDIIRKDGSDPYLSEPIIAEDWSALEGIFTDVLPKPETSHGETIH